MNEWIFQNIYLHLYVIVHIIYIQQMCSTWSPASMLFCYCCCYSQSVHGRWISHSEQFWLFVNARRPNKFLFISITAARFYSLKLLPASRHPKCVLICIRYILMRCSYNGTSGAVHRNHSHASHATTTAAATTTTTTLKWMVFAVPSAILDRNQKPIVPPEEQPLSSYSYLYEKDHLN